jgi:beta-lactamase class A
MRQSVVLAAALGLAVLFGCAKKAEKVAVDVPEDRLAAKVEDWQLTREQLEEYLRRLPDPQRQKYSTPEGMARLLQKIWKREALSEASSALLLDIMLRCQTGDARIKGLLPPGTDVMHKTGTLGIGVANDVGIMRLPEGAGHVVITVFVKESQASSAVQERTIAQVARAAYDYFLFTTR